MTIQEVMRSLKPTTEILPAAPFDVAVVGAGPAGVATALSASSLHLSTVLIEESISLVDTERKEALSADRTISSGAASIRQLTQQMRTSHSADTPLLLHQRVSTLKPHRTGFTLELMDGRTISSRVVVAATGSRYRRLSIPDYSRFENHGIHYAATGMEAALSIGDDVVVVGGGDTAGRCAVFLSGFARRVHILVRGNRLSVKMSDYLVERIHNMPDIVVHTSTEIVELHGDTRLERVTWKDPLGARQSHVINNLFLMIGAIANSEWLFVEVERNEDGFIRTGSSSSGRDKSRYAASHPGVYAVGDIRADSIRSIDAAVREGFGLANDIHRYVVSLEPPSQ